MNHNGFVPYTDPVREPGDVILMVHKLLSGGKSYAALLECERWLASENTERAIKANLEAYDQHLTSERYNAAQLTDEEEHS